MKLRALLIAQLASGGPSKTASLQLGFGMAAAATRPACGTTSRSNFGARDEEAGNQQVRVRLYDYGRSNNTISISDSFSTHGDGAGVVTAQHVVEEDEHSSVSSPSGRPPSYLVPQQKHHLQVPPPLGSSQWSSSTLAASGEESLTHVTASSSYCYDSEEDGGPHDCAAGAPASSSACSSPGESQIVRVRSPFLSSEQIAPLLSSWPTETQTSRQVEDHALRVHVQAVVLGCGAGRLGARCAANQARSAATEVSRQSATPVEELQSQPQQQRTGRGATATETNSGSRTSGGDGERRAGASPNGCICGILLAYRGKGCGCGILAYHAPHAKAITPPT